MLSLSDPGIQATLGPVGRKERVWGSGFSGLGLAMTQSPRGRLLSVGSHQLAGPTSMRGLVGHSEQNWGF